MKLVLAALFTTILSGSNLASAEPGESTDKRSVMASWTSVSVSVADLDGAIDLWHNTFGLEVFAEKRGADPELAALWGIAPADIRRQALLGTPGVSAGRIHFVEFNDPGSAVREGAQVFDQCPKNLDIYVRDMPARIRELKAAGQTFRTDDFSAVTAPDGTVFREIHMAGHDAINIVLLEVIGLQLPFTEKGYAAVGPVITIVGDAGLERNFYREILGLDVLNDNILEGPEIERMIGLPPGSALDVSIWGAAGESFGQMEIINYRGVEGNNLYPTAIPKQRGILHVTYAAEDLSQLIRRLELAGVSWSEGGRRSILPGSGRFIRFHTPAGFRIEVFESD